MKWVLIMSMLFVLPAKPKPLTLQEVAEIRVRYMAKKNYRWHPPYSVCNPFKHGARFEGCGWGGKNRDPKTLGTCTPRRKLRLAADAVAIGKHGRTYRLRLWR